MKKSFIIGSALIGAIGVSSFDASAQSRRFDPAASCSVVLAKNSALERRLVGNWAFGYIARANDTTLIISPSKVKSVIALLTRACSNNPNRKFSVLVEALSLKIKDRAAKNNGQTSSTGVTIDDVRVVLRRFFARNADYPALTAALKPTDRDIRAVFAEPLATSLIARNNQMFKPGISIRPKPEHATFLALLTTTRKLKNGHVDLQQFPGGYEKVRKYFIKDVPIARFKFVKRGAKLGLAFDGLIFVNGRWVLVPKPWRGLK